MNRLNFRLRIWSGYHIPSCANIVLISKTYKRHIYTYIYLFVYTHTVYECMCPFFLAWRVFAVRCVGGCGGSQALREMWSSRVREPEKQSLTHEACIMLEYSIQTRRGKPEAKRSGDIRKNGQFYTQRSHEWHVHTVERDPAPPKLWICGCWRPCSASLVGNPPLLISWCQVDGGQPVASFFCCWVLSIFKGNH